MCTVDQLCLMLRSISSQKAEERQAAEAFMATIKKQMTTHNMLIDICLMQHIDEETRLSAAIALKNIFRSHWSSKSDTAEAILPESEKAVLRKRMFDLIVGLVAFPRILAQAQECLRIVAFHDYPERYSELLDQICKGFEGGPHDIYATMVALALISKLFKGRCDENQPQDVIVSRTFPQLVNSAVVLMETVRTGTGPITVPLAVAMLKKICHVFYDTIWSGIPDGVAEVKMLQSWFEIVLGVIDMTPPQGVDQSTLELFWKAQRRMFLVLMKFAQKGDQTRSNGEEPASFVLSWNNGFGQRATQSVVRWLMAHSQTASSRTTNVAVMFLSNAVEKSAFFEQVQPHLNELLSNVLFPLLMLKPEDQENWIDDAANYLREQFDCESAFNDPRKSVDDLLHSLVNYQRKDTVLQILQFCASMIHADNVRKDASLRMVGAIADLIAPITKIQAKRDAAVVPGFDLDQFMQGLVLPLFQSPCMFLRMRAVWVYGEFVGGLATSGKLAHLACCWNAVVGALSDPELPIRARAAITLATILRHGDEINEAVVPSITHVMERLLVIMTEVMLEELPETLCVLIEQYSEHVVPHSVNILSQLVAQFMNLIQNDADNEGATAGTVSTINKLIRAMHKRAPQSLASTETILMPFYEACTTPDYVDYLEDAIEILTYCTNSATGVSPQMYEIFTRIFQALIGGNTPQSSGSWAIDLLGRCVPLFGNLMAKDSLNFLTGVSSCNLTYIQMVYCILEKTLGKTQDPEITQAAIVLAGVIFEIYTKEVDDLFTPVMSLLLPYLDCPDEELRKCACCALSTMIWYNLAAFSQVLAARDPEGISRITAEMDKLVSLHDRRIALFAVSKLLRHHQVLAPTLVDIFVSHAIAIPRLMSDAEDREDVCSDIDNASEASLDDDDLDAFLDGGLDMMSIGDGDLLELCDSPLDKVNVFTVLQESLGAIPGSEQTKLESLAGSRWKKFEAVMLANVRMNHVG